MSTTTLSSLARVPSPVAAGGDPIVRSRKLTAAILTSASVATASLFALAFGSAGFFIVAFSLALPLTLTWRAADVLRSDETRS